MWCIVILYGRPCNQYETLGTTLQGLEGLWRRPCEGEKEDVTTNSLCYSSGRYVSSGKVCVDLRYHLRSRVRTLFLKSRLDLRIWSKNLYILRGWPDFRSLLLHVEVFEKRKKKNDLTLESMFLESKAREIISGDT